MRHRHAVAIDRVVVARQLSQLTQRGIQMADELVAVEIEVHPASVAASLGAAENFSIETACFVDVPNLHGDVKGGQRLVHGFPRKSLQAPTRASGTAMPAPRTLAIGPGVD